MKTLCPHCHRPMMQNKQMLTKALGDILLTMACKFPKDIPFHLQRDLVLSKSQYNNAQKLRYWGLIKKTYVDGKRLGGFWQLTGLAESFIMQRSLLPKWKMTFNNSVVSASEKKVMLEDLVGSFEVPAIWAERAKPIKEYQLSIF